MKERGNILFLILLAVILFAALSYAVTRDQSGQEKSASGEQADLLASQLVQVGNLLENTMMRVKLVDGVPEYGFDLNGTNSNSSANATCTQASCRLVAGGNGGGQVSFPYLPDWASNNPANPAFRRANVWLAQIVDVGTSAPDVILVYRYLTDEVCQSIQKVTGSTDISLSIIDDRGTSVDYDYSGTLTALPPSLAVWGDSNTALRGKRSFCHRNNGGTPHQNLFIHVLIPR